VDKEGSFRSNADRLADALAGSRSYLTSVDEGDRPRRAEAIDHFARYVDLLRQTTAATLMRYSFKREFADGRWDIAETELPAEPHVGEFVWFADTGAWKVSGIQRVPRPVGQAPPHEFFACAPAA
jgi:hypothetical protein